MKKHTFILIIGALGLVILLVAIFAHGGIDFTGGTAAADVEDGFDARIEAVGKKPYVADTFKNISMSILASSIDENRKNDLTEVLEKSKQKALALRIEQWFNQYCPDASVNEAIAEARNCSKPINELAVQLAQYQKYQHALSFSAKLNAFLSEKYDETKHNSLYANFQAALQGQKFANCPLLKGRLQQMNTELMEFKSFVIIWEDGMKGGSEATFITYVERNSAYSDKMLKYAYYKQEFDNLTKK
jgi:hypothetical protein